MAKQSPASDTCAAERTLRITKTTIDAAAPAAKRYAVWDGDIPGFGVRVETSGTKTYVLRYRAFGGGRKAPSRQMKIGDVGEMTPAEARQRAKGLRDAVLRGEDPSAARQARRAASTMQELAAFYLDDYAVSAGLRPSTLRDMRSILRRFILPALGMLKVAEVTVADVRALHASVFKKAGKYQANRVVAALSTLFGRAMENGWRADNPTRAIKRHPEQPRQRYLKAAEVHALWSALDAYHVPAIADAVRLLLLTGARRNEVLHATWDQFDLQAGRWIKPSAHTKQKRDHKVELAGPALTLLRKMRAGDPDGVCLFPGTNPNAPRADLKRHWPVIRNAASLVDFRLHDLRHTFASYMLTIGAPLAVVGQALGHTQPITTARYGHIVENAQAKGLAQAGAQLVALGTGMSGSKGGRRLVLRKDATTGAMRVTNAA